MKNLFFITSFVVSTIFLSSCSSTRLKSSTSPSKVVSTEGDSIKTIKNKLPIMVSIPSGRFTMGCVKGRDNTQVNCDSSELPSRNIKVPSFEMSKTEITIGEYMACVKKRACNPPEWLKKDDPYGNKSHYKEMGESITGLNFPIIGISWVDAYAYTIWLRKSTGQDWRLPTETQWEYAARGGEKHNKYPWGNKANHQYANYGDDTCCKGLKSGKDKWVDTSPSGSFPANAYGLYDMHGNVAEWVSDCWHKNYKNAPSSHIKWSGGDCKYRTLRGGYMDNVPKDIRSASRSYGWPGLTDSRFGFRVVKVKH